MSEDLWETHAGWWQHGFTDGADPEYEEQILPLAEEHLAGRPVCSTSGAARASSPAGPPASASRGRRRGSDHDQNEAAAAGRRPGERPAARPSGSRSLTASFDAVVDVPGVRAPR